MRRYRQRRRQYYTYYGFDDEEIYPILPPPPDEEESEAEENDDGSYDDYDDSGGYHDGEDDLIPSNAEQPDWVCEEDNEDDDDDPWRGVDEAIGKAKDTMRSLEDSFLNMVEQRFGKDARDFMEKFVHIPSNVLEAVETYFPEIRRAVSEIIEKAGIFLAEAFLYFVMEVAHAWKSMKRFSSMSLYEKFVSYCKRLVMYLTKLVVKAGVTAARMFEELSEKLGLDSEDEEDDNYDRGVEYEGEDYLRDYYNYW